MGSYDYLLLLGAAAAVVLGFIRLAGKYHLTLLTGSLMVAIFFAICAALYWVGSKFNRT